MHKRSCSRELEPAFLKAWDAVAEHGSLAANGRWIVDASLQKITEHFFMSAVDHVRAASSEFCANISEHCDNV